MRNSPYFTGAAPNFGPPSGMAALIGQQREGGRIDMSGYQMFADAVDKFKAQQDMGKAAEYFVKANPDVLSQMGIHPEEWKTLGARDKSAAMGGFVKNLATQDVMQRLAEVGRQSQARADFQSWIQNNPEASSQQRLAAGLQAGLPMEEFARLAQGERLVQEGLEGQAWQEFARNYAEGGEGMPAGLTGQDAQAWAAAGGDANAPAANPMQRTMEAFARMGQTSPRLASALANRVLPTVMAGGMEGKTAGQPEVMTLGNTGVIFNRKTGAFQITPESKAEAEAKNQKQPEGYVQISDPNEPDGPVIRVPLSVAKAQYPHLLKGLDRADAGQVPPKAADQNEVIRTTKNGQKAVFDSKTRKFIRYAP